MPGMRLLCRSLALAAWVVGLVTVWIPVGVAAAILPAEGSSIDASGLTSGPAITDAGLVWDSAQGIMLSGPTGATSVLYPTPVAGENVTDWLGLDWWVVA